MSVSLQPRTGPADLVLAELVDELTARMHAGERLDLEACLAEYPEHAEQLRQLLPALEVLAELGDLVQSAATVVPAAPPMDDSQAPIVGMLGDFRIIREIGRGGMGVVYQAEQISLARRVALKVLPFASTLDARHLQRFKNEAQAAACLHHTNIVPVFATGCERGVHFYAMQFIEGQTLAEVIGELGKTHRTDAEDAEKKPAGSTATDQHQLTLPSSSLRSLRLCGKNFFRTVAELGIQAAEALEYAHQMGIVHRDIKPANLLIESSPLSASGRGAGGEGLRLWITDFGLAQVQSDTRLTMTGDLLGTLRYMSPEQALAHRVIVDHRTDIYSFGVTLYELLTLQPAFDGKDRQEVLRQIAFDEPRPPRKINKSIPAELETIVLKAMEKRPEERYATAQELAEDLKRFLKEQPIRARRPSLWHIAAKWARRHQPVVWAAAAVLLVTAVALGAVAAVSWQKERQAQNALDQARAQRELARRTVHDMYTQVAEKWLKNEPHLQPLQREFLLKALAYYEEFAREEANDPEAKREKALALRRVGDIELKLGNPKEAEAPLRQALALFDELTTEAGNQPRDRHERVICLRAMTKQLNALGKRAEMERTVRRAVELAEALAVEFPGERAYRHSWAQCLTHEGGLLMQERRRAEAEAVLRKARAELDRLVAESPDDASVRVSLLGTSINHYLALMGQDRSPDTEALLEKGLVHADWLLARFADDPEVRSVAAGVYCAQADLLSTTQREEAALAPYAKAAPNEEWLADRYPDVPEYRYEAACTLLNMGQTCLDLRKVDEGERHVGRALLHFEKLWAAQPDNPTYTAVPLRELARAFNWLGTYRAEDRQLPRAEKALRQSIAFWQRLAGEYPKDPAQRHLLAGVHRQLAGVHGLAGRYAAAVAEFRRAITLDDADWRALTLLAEILATAPDEKMRNPPEAVTLARRAVALAPKEEAPRTVLGYAYHATGEHEQARAALQRATELGPTGGTALAWLYLAKSCWHLGDKEQARRWYDKAVAWMEKNQPQDQQLRRFQAEAAELLGIKDPEPELLPLPKISDG